MKAENRFSDSGGPARRSGNVSCSEIKADLVALQARELSPLRAEVVMAHLAKCPSCREEAMELELAARSLGSLRVSEPPTGLAARTFAYVSAARGYRPGPVLVGAPSPEPAPGEVSGKEPAPALLRPVRNPLLRALAAAVLLFAAVTFAFPDVAEAVGKAQIKVLGPKVSGVLGRAADAILRAFRL